MARESGLITGKPGSIRRDDWRRVQHGPSCPDPGTHGIRSSMRNTIQSIYCSERGLVTVFPCDKKRLLLPGSLDSPGPFLRGPSTLPQSMYTYCSISRQRFFAQRKTLILSLRADYPVSSRSTIPACFLPSRHLLLFSMAKLINQLRNNTQAQAQAHNCLTTVT